MRPGEGGHGRAGGGEDAVRSRPDEGVLAVGLVPDGDDEGSLVVELDAGPELGLGLVGEPVADPDGVTRELKHGRDVFRRRLRKPARGGELEIPGAQHGQHRRGRSGRAGPCAPLPRPFWRPCASKGRFLERLPTLPLESAAGTTGPPVMAPAHSRTPRGEGIAWDKHLAKGLASQAGRLVSAARAPRAGRRRSAGLVTNLLGGPAWIMIWARR